MVKKQFKCTLIEDIILTLQPPQEGFYQSLNFIPGRCFRSIVANSSEAGLAIARKQDIRFSDAHIAHIQTNNREKTFWRTMHIPFCMMYPKHWSVGHSCNLHHFYDRQNDKRADGHPLQMKQCRHGYYAFYDGTAYPEIIPHNSSTKLVVKNQNIFTTDSIRYGRQFLFEVETEEESDLNTVADILTEGYHQIGRSRGAQYGTVKIEEQTFRQIHKWYENGFEIKGEREKKMMIVYADSRLVFLDEYGQCTFRPTAEQLGIPGGEIDWSLTQIRTFCYMPWNSNRQTQEADISGFEKGSTFVIRVSKDVFLQQADAYIGSYCQDGLGHVIFNPDFLSAQQGTNGLAYYHISEIPPSIPKQKPNNTKKDLIKYINRVQRVDDDNNFIYRKVNEFIKDNLSEFKPNPQIGQTITSQHWLTIRNKIMDIQFSYKLIDFLFGKEVNGKYEGGFLTQQSMKNKWTENRINMLLKFIENFNDADLKIKALNILVSELYTQTLDNSSRGKRI